MSEPVAESSMDAVSRVETLLRGILSGALTIRATQETWDQVWAGNVAFQVSSGDTLVIFNDCDSFDYIDAVTFADGASLSYRDMNAWDANDISSRFTQSEWEKLEPILKAAPCRD